MLSMETYNSYDSLFYLDIDNDHITTSFWAIVLRELYLLP